MSLLERVTTKNREFQFSDVSRKFPALFELSVSSKPETNPTPASR